MASPPLSLSPPAWRRDANHAMPGGMATMRCDMSINARVCVGVACPYTWTGRDGVEAKRIGACRLAKALRVPYGVETPSSSCYIHTRNLFEERAIPSRSR